MTVNGNGFAPIKNLMLVEDCEKEADKVDFAREYLHFLLMQSFAQEESDSLKKLRGYAQAQLHIDSLLNQLEEFQKALNERRRHLTEQVIPDMMDELGIPELSISENHEISVNEKVIASIPKARAEEACAWLEKHGEGALIKQQVLTKFSTKEREIAEKVIAALTKMGVTPEVNRTVHHATLSSWVRSKLEDGEEIPFDLFGVFRRRASTIKEKN